MQQQHKIKIEEIINSIICGHVLSILRKIPSDSIDCAVTSPPYFGLRSYNTVPQIWGGNPKCEHDWIYATRRGISGGTKSSKVKVKGSENFQIVPDTQFATCSNCGAWLGELGQEPSPQMFIRNLTEIFSETMRVLKPTGSLWINISDSYAANRAYQVTGTKQVNGSQPTKYPQPQCRDFGIEEKSLMGIPDRLKIAMIDSGFINRNEIIWHRPNQMPSSARDRFTVDYEKFYWFTKNKKYYFEQQFEPYTEAMNRWGGDNLVANGESSWDDGTGQDTYRNRKMRPNPKGKNKRTLWSINTVPSKVKHFASYPEALIETPILSTCPEGGIVLDMFFGSGTTGVVAKRLNRNWIGIELNPDYVEIANNRLGLV